MTKTFILITVYTITFLVLDVYFSARLIHILCISISQKTAVSPLKTAEKVPSDQIVWHKG